jgi:hypothetical protein
MSQDSSVSSENKEKTGDLFDTPFKAGDINIQTPDEKVTPE